MFGWEGRGGGVDRIWVARQYCVQRIQYSELQKLIYVCPICTLYIYNINFESFSHFLAQLMPCTLLKRRNIWQNVRATMTWYAPDPFQIQNGKQTHPPHAFLSLYIVQYSLSAVIQYIFMLALVLSYAVVHNLKRICQTVLFTLKHQMETSLLMFFSPL